MKNTTKLEGATLAHQQRQAATAARQGDAAVAEA